VPYKGGAPMLNALLGNEVHMAISGAITAIPLIRDGRLRALGIGDTRRSDLLPDVPTIAEAGVPGFEASNWHGLFAPAKTPRAVIERLHREISLALKSSDVRQRLLSLGSEPVGNAPDVWGRVVEAEVIKWGKVARAAGIKPE